MMEKVQLHKHTGIDSPKINAYELLVNARGADKIINESSLFFQTTTTLPSGTPKNFLDQIRIYINGGNVYLYIFDSTNNTWVSNTLT
jgi:hypothetical protein